MADRDGSGDTYVIPVVAEEVVIEKRRVETGRTRIRKRIERDKSVVDEPLLSETYDVERVPVDREVDQAAPPRQEGDTLIVPVYEERIVVQKKLVLVEEIHLKRRREERRDPQTHEIVKENVTIEKVPVDAEPEQ